jgi:D-alanyl-D-alanine carboxypeptidase (penicillin-binding protein 5/6)
MIRSLLSVLLMGMLPVMRVPAIDQGTLQALSIAPPSLVVSQPAQKILRNGVSASGILVTDLQSGQAVYGRNFNRRRPIGSLTKLMTALLIVERHPLDEWVTVPDGLEKVEGQKARFPAGSEFTVGDLLSAMLIYSANDAAVALARYDAGSVSAFADEMNQRAKELGLRNTAYTNPSGLDQSGEWSTPADVAWLASYVLQKPDLRSRMSTKETEIRDRTGKVRIALEHTHALLHQDGGVIAGKTGTTVAAGQCLLSLVSEGGREYVVVLLGSRERYTDMRAVLHALASFPA